MLPYKPRALYFGVPYNPCLDLVSVHFVYLYVCVCNCGVVLCAALAECGAVQSGEERQLPWQMPGGRTPLGSRGRELALARPSGNTTGCRGSGQGDKPGAHSECVWEEGREWHCVCVLICLRGIWSWTYVFMHIQFTNSPSVWSLYVQESGGTVAIKSPWVLIPCI